MPTEERSPEVKDFEVRFTHFMAEFMDKKIFEDFVLIFRTPKGHGGTMSTMVPEDTSTILIEAGARMRIKPPDEQRTLAIDTGTRHIFMDSDDATLMPGDGESH